MRKKIKNLPTKIMARLMIFGFLFQIFAPTLVFAVATQDANSIQIRGSQSVEGNKFNYSDGSATVTKNDAPVTVDGTNSFAVTAGDEIEVALTPKIGYKALLRNDSNGSYITLTENTYTFTIGNDSEGTLSLSAEFSLASVEYDFTINGESFTGVSPGDNVLVPENFNMNSLTEFYVTKIAVENGATYNYADNEYSLSLLDNQDRRIFEVNFSKKSDNFVKFRGEAHAENILAEDIVAPKTATDYYPFYITSINFIKEGFKGVEISTNVMPDNYDFTVWNGVDLSQTTLSNPGKVTAYYGESVINLSSLVSTPIKTIELVEDSGVPSSAIEIDNENASITMLSNFYNEVLVKVTLEDDTVGYVSVNRIGIFIGTLNKNQDTFYHGAMNGDVNGNLDVQTDKQRLVAVFYHDNGTDYEDYDLIVNIIYTDGKTETKMATGVGSVANASGEISGSDYILWSGDSLESIAKASVTAVKKGAITDEDTFGGATFGSGSGVVWENE